MIFVQAMSGRDSIAPTAVDSVLSGTGLRETARRFEIPPSPLSRMARKIKGNLPEKTNGRSPRFSSTEKKTLSDSVSEMSALGTPLSRAQLKVLTKIVIDSLSTDRQKQIGFKTTLQGKCGFETF